MFEPPDWHDGDPIPVIDGITITGTVIGVVMCAYQTHDFGINPTPFSRSVVDYVLALGTDARTRLKEATKGMRG